jgi:glycosyltransferase involved in cell wall biosynthesis
MHIGLYSPALPSRESSNGIVTYVRFLRGALRQLDHRVTVVTPHGIEWADGRIEVRTADRPVAARIGRLADRFTHRGSNLVRNGAVLARMIRDVHRNDRFDVFEMEESFGWVGQVGLDVPVVTRLHGPHFLGKDEVEAANQTGISAERIREEGRAIANADGVTCPSARLLSVALSHYGIIPQCSAAIYNPIPVATSAESWSIDRCDLDQVLFVGRFDLRKGADIALAGYAKAAAHNPNLRLVMCGPDRGLVQSDGRRIHFAEYLKTSVPAHLHDRIRFMGELPPSEIGRLRLESALCLSTSRFEVFAYSMIEALAIGMPLVASDTFGMSELLCDREQGYVAPVGDMGAVAATLCEAIENPRDLARIGAAGRELCAEVLDPLLIAEKSIGFYRSLPC